MKKLRSYPEITTPLGELDLIGINADKSAGIDGIAVCNLIPAHIAEHHDRLNAAKDAVVTAAVECAECRRECCSLEMHEALDALEKVRDER